MQFSIFIVTVLCKPSVKQRVFENSRTEACIHIARAHFIVAITCHQNKPALDLV